MTVQDACGEAQYLIPWVVNRTATAGDQRLLHQHVAGCDQCRRELAQTLALHARVGGLVSALPGMPTDAPVTLADVIPDDGGQQSRPSLEKLVVVMEALGLPDIITDALKATIDLRSGRPTLCLELPLVAPVSLRP